MDTKFKKGQIPWNKGIPHSQEARKKMSESKKKAGIIPPSRLGIKDSLETRLKKQKSARRGEKNNFWKGGIDPINHKIRSSLEYKIWRDAVFQRDNYTCIWCGKRNGFGKTITLNADHIKPFALYPELRFAIDNGRTLCIDCHKTTDTFGRRKIYDTIKLTNRPKNKPTH